MDAEEVRSLWVVAADEIAGFVRDSCRRDDPDQWIAKGELYDEYKRWCEKKGKVPESQKRVTTSLSRIGILGFYPSSGGGRKKQVHAYKGIRWNEEISQYRKPKTVDQGVLSV
jgi:phage/plasmid-associated DNA primase